MTSTRLADRPDIGVGGGDGIDEAGADGLHVEGKAMAHAETVLDADGRRRKRIVGRRGRADDHVDVIRRQAGIVECRTRGLAAPSEDVVSSSPAMITLANTGALDDPLIGGVDDMFHVGIGHNALRKCGSEPANH
jgi:hypothetical protein